jgi:hypothetical protein
MIMSRIAAWMSERLGVAANLVAFCICAGIAFVRNDNALFYSFDGVFTLLADHNQRLNSNGMFEFSNDFLQGIGGIGFLIDFRVIPFFWPLNVIADPLMAKLAVYILVAAAVFLSAYGLTRLLSANRLAAIVAGWWLGLIATPVSPAPAIFYPILYSSPVFVLVVVWPLLAFWFTNAIGRGAVLVDVLLGVVLFGLLLFLLGGAPFFVPIVAVGMLPYLALTLAFVRSRRELWRKALVLAAVLVAAAALRWPWYLLGLFRYTAPSTFPDDFTVVYKSAIYASIMFQQQPFGWNGPVLVVAAVAGAILSIRRVTGVSSAAAWTLLATVGVLLILGAVIPNVRWILPPSLYPEVAFWPLYAAFAAIALVTAARLVGTQLSRFTSLRLANIRWEWLLPLPGAASAFAIAQLYPPSISGFPYPPGSPPIVEVLRKNVALGPQAEFRGRVATIPPVDPQGRDAWVQQFSQASEVAAVTGNDHMAVGLWYNLVPTLFAYNQFISPAFHALIKRALQSPPLVHQRNITVISTPHLRVLELLGVRYIVAPASDNSLGSLRQVETVGGKSWHLTELTGANLASYSPTNVLIRPDLQSALDIVLDDSVDLAQTAVVYRGIAGPLVRAESTSLSMVNGDLRLSGASAGRSLIVVPLEYSHCLELRPIRGREAGTDVSLQRVQGILTGVVFEHKVDVVLAFRTGPLHNPLCLFEDYQDFKKLLATVPPAGSRQ